MTSCDTCAFGKEGAAKEPLNSLTAQLCAFGAIPFYCHHAKDGQEYDWRNDPLGPLRLHPANRKVCAGWRARVRMLKGYGYYPNAGIIAIRRYAARRGFEWLKRFLIPDIGRGKKKEAQAALRRCIKFVSSQRIDDLTIPL